MEPKHISSLEAPYLKNVDIYTFKTEASGRIQFFVCKNTHECYYIGCVIDKMHAGRHNYVPDCIYRISKNSPINDINKICEVLYRLDHAGEQTSITSLEAETICAKLDSRNQYEYYDGEFNYKKNGADVVELLVEDEA